MSAPGLMTISEAGELRDRYGYRAVIVVGVRDNGVVDVMSHARSQADCRVIGDYAQQQFGAHLPVVPFQTWFGWGHQGVPLALDREQLASLSRSGRAYAATNTAPNAEGRK